MQATITHNTERNTIEIRFPAKPTTDVLTGLKALNFRWYGKEAFWYAPHTIDRLVKVQTLLGDEVAADATFAPRERSERANTTDSDKGSLPFLQHLAAYSLFQSLAVDKKESWEHDETAGMNTYDGRVTAVNIFLDSTGNVVMQRMAKRWINFGRNHAGPLEAEDIEKWWQVGKSGKVEELQPGKLKYDSGLPVYSFSKSIYGISIKELNEIRHHRSAGELEGWYRPAKNDGSLKYLSNGKQIEANKRELVAIGMEVKLTGNGVVFRPTNTSPQPQKIMVDSQSDYCPFVLPNRAVVPPQWRKPYYELPAVADYKGRVKLRSDLVKIEVLLGKLEIAKYKVFDGMQDMYDYTSNDQLVWYTPQNGMPYTSHYDTPSHSGVNQITWDSYYLRYNGKSAPAYLTLGTATDLPADQRTSAAEQVAKGKAAPTKPAAPGVLAEKFFKAADSLLAESKRKKQELQGAQQNTPKRLKEYNSKQIDADMAHDRSVYYRAIGVAINQKRLPAILTGISPVLKDNHLYLFVAGYANGGGYYDAYRANEPRYTEYKNNKTGLVKQAEELGLKSYEQVEEAYGALQSLLSAVNGQTSHDPQAAKLKELVDKWRFIKQPGFFPTPKEIGRDMVRAANIKPGNSILEPSAGLGDLAEVIRDEYPANELSVCETMYSLREILTLKGFRVVGDDFLQHQQTYNRIIMNPPFEQGQDIDHVRHAHSLLKPGGWVVALMSEGPFFRTDKKAVAFREWLEAQEHYTNQLPEGSFQNAFNSTGVKIRMVMIEKDGLERRSVSETATRRKEVLRKRHDVKTTAVSGREVSTMQTGTKRAGVMAEKAQQQLALRARALKLKLALLQL